jgi:hypothetical protein
VSFDDVALYTSSNGFIDHTVAWSDILLIAINIEERFLPFPFWYVGTQTGLVRIPNDAEGAQALFFDGFSQHVHDYKSEATFRTIIEAQGAVDGSFIVWKAPVR